MPDTRPTCFIVEHQTSADYALLCAIVAALGKAGYAVNLDGEDGTGYDVLVEVENPVTGTVVRTLRLVED